MHSDDKLRWTKGRNEAVVDDHFGNPVPAQSFSGNETDHLFWSHSGQQFHDLDEVSGLAHPGDGRSASQLDYDRDGWIDLVVASANAPSLQLYRNELGEVRRGPEPGFVALRFEGGNTKAVPSDTWSARDGYGAIVRLELADRTLLREHDLSDAKGSQHSATMLVGLGAAQRVERISVRWPSGREQEVLDVPSGSLLTLHEDPSHNDGEAVTIESYAPDRRPTPPSTTPTAAAPTPGLPADAATADLNVVVAMSTHCAACKRAEPQLALLRRSFEADELNLYGVGTDMGEDSDELAAYARDQKPTYRVLADQARAEREALKLHIQEAFHTDLTPVSLVADRRGRLLGTFPGVPTVSDLRRLLDGAKESL